jgi:hypothetical protein
MAHKFNTNVQEMMAKISNTERANKRLRRAAN